MARRVLGTLWLMLAFPACNSDGEGTSGGGSGGSGGAGGGGGSQDAAAGDQPPGSDAPPSDTPASDMPSVDAPASEPMPDKPSVKAECLSYCTCMKGACSKVTGYPWTTEMGCWSACETYDAKTLGCWTMWCESASTASASKKPHLCEHAWGKHGLDECP